MLEETQDTIPFQSIMPYGTESQGFMPKLPPGMNPLGQAADLDYSRLSWYEMGALSEAILKMFPPAATALDRVLTFVIGDGFNVRPNTGIETLDDDLENYFAEISGDPKQIDYDEESDLMGVCRKLLRGALVPGGHFALFVKGGKTQLIEAYRCKSPLGTIDDERTVGGVKLSANRRKQVGFYFETDDVGDWGQYLTQPDNVQYVSADDSEGNKQCVHFRLPGRVSGTKSDGVMAVALQSLFQHLQIRANVCTKTEIANAVAFVRRVSVNAPNFQEMAKSVNKHIENSNRFSFNNILDGKGFRSGQTIIDPAGMESKFESPNVPAPAYFELDDILLRELGALFWVSKELIQMNASTSNYSSIRMLMKAAEPGLRYFQNQLAYQFLRHWWVFVLRDLTAKDRAVNNALTKANYNPHLAGWNYPGWKGLDPEKDFESDNGRMSNGHASDRKVFQERGADFMKEKPLIIQDAWWGIELCLKKIQEPANRKLLENSGLNQREAFAWLYARTSPNGMKVGEIVAKLNAADAVQQSANANMLKAEKIANETTDTEQKTDSENTENTDRRAEK